MEEPTTIKRDSRGVREATQLPDGLRFDRAAMLVGRSLYWGVSPQTHVENLATLLGWCLSLPAACLGISMPDVATLIRDVYASTGESPAADVQEALERYGVNSRPAILWPPDADIWKEQRLARLEEWLKQAAQAKERVHWIDPQDANWWLSATMQSLSSYALLFASGMAGRDLFRLIGRHDCTVFAPFDGAATFDRLVQLVMGLGHEQRARHMEALTDPRLDRAGLAAIGSVYWSWRLIDFANVDGSIVCTPMLALWSEWPSSVIWAPQSHKPQQAQTLAGLLARRQYSADEMALLLEESYWQRIETLFSRARFACGLGVAEPEFAEIESRPPVFFFAAPTEVPIKPEEYAESLRPSIMPLVRTCLRSTDPLANHVAWALLEGDLVALRREVSSQRAFEPRYLLLPASAKSPTARPIEDDIDRVTDSLTFLEFSIGHETRDVDTDIDPLASRAGIWGGTLDVVNTLTGEAIDLLPSAHKSSLGRINERLAAIHLVIRNLQTRIETATSDAVQVVRKYDNYLDSTDEYFRRTATSSSVPHVPTLNLREAILNSYPYQYVKTPLESLRTAMSQLNSEVERISDSLKTILDLSDRSIRGFSSRLNGIAGVFIALLALLVGVAQVLGAQNASSSSAPPGSSNNIFDILNRFFQSPELILGARLLFEGVALGLIATALLYGLEWLYQRRPRQRHKFIKGVQRFRAQVDTANTYLQRAKASEQGEAAEIWKQIDELDDEAVRILGDLWKELRKSAEAGDKDQKKNQPARKIQPRSVREWEARARLMEHAIELFDLAPTTIVLPRALCVLRFKSTDFQSRTAISDWDFDRSLRVAGISLPQAGTLRSWLSPFENLQQIQKWDVATFAQTLKEYGVTIVPDQRTPDRWEGPLTRR